MDIISVISLSKFLRVFVTGGVNICWRCCNLYKVFSGTRTIRFVSFILGKNRTKNTSKTIIAEAYQSRCCFWRSSSVPESLETFQPSYASSKGKWVSSFLKTMPSEIGFPMTLTSGAFVNKKRNKQTSHELQNNLDSSCILKHHKMTQNSVSFSYQKASFQTLHKFSTWTHLSNFDQSEHKNWT